MCNFSTLYFYEIKKILQKKMVWISFGIIFAFVIFMGVGDLFFSYEKDGAKVSAYEKIVNEKENARELSGREIDDSLLDEMKRDDTKKYDAIYQIVKYLINSDEEIRNVNESKLYQTRTDNIEQMFIDQRLTEGEIAYWREKESDIKIPFTYEYTRGYLQFIDLIYNLNIFMVVMLGISLSGVFADEHFRKTDQLILGSRYGKKILYFAKLGAGISVGTLGTVILLLAGTVLAFAIYGADGFHGVLQLVIIKSSWQLSVGAMSICLLAFTLLLALLYSVFTMFLSEGLKSSAAVMAVLLGMFFVTFFFNFPYQYRVPSQILGLMPAKILRAGGWADLRLVKIFGHYLMTYQFAPVLYFAAIVIFILAGKRMYERFQIGGR